MNSFINKIKVYKVNSLSNLLKPIHANCNYDYSNYVVVLIDEYKNIDDFDNAKAWYPMMDRTYLKDDNKYIAEKLFITEGEAEELRIYVNQLLTNKSYETLNIINFFEPHLILIDCRLGITDNNLILSSFKVWDYYK